MSDTPDLPDFTREQFDQLFKGGTISGVVYPCCPPQGAKRREWGQAIR
ncbi:hypothetical protein SAMN05877809_10576 [Rhodobacter sp. JA431]|nr:hypothetical protein SAMN05877809_10576 [Rhodobacter sp. JA431]